MLASKHGRRAAHLDDWTRLARCIGYAIYSCCFLLDSPYLRPVGLPAVPLAKEVDGHDARHEGRHGSVHLLTESYGQETKLA